MYEIYIFCAHLLLDAWLQKIKEAKANEGFSNAVSKQPLPYILFVWKDHQNWSKINALKKSWRDKCFE